MATPAIQRPHSVCGVLNLPVIKHPMAHLSSKKNLNVVGLNERNLSSAGSVSTGASLDTSTRQRKDPASNFPALKGRRHSRNPTWPEAQRRGSSADAATRKRINPDKLYVLIRRQLSIHFNVFQQQFRANDPLDRGVVSKGALSRVLYQLVGYVAMEDVGRLLEWLKIDSSDGIPFNKFVSAFMDEKTESKGWVIPFSQRGAPSGRKIPFPEEHLRNKVAHGDHDYVTASYANAFLKEKCRHSDFNLCDHLSPTCFEPGAHVLAPQLSECLKSIGVPLNNDEMALLWSRYDLQNTGILDAAWFFERIGLDRSGCYLPRARTAPPRTSRSWGVTAQDARSEYSRTPSRGPSGQLETVSSPDQPRPASTNVISSLMRKLEQNYYTMLVSCQRVDSNDNGLISKAALMTILREYGIPLHPFGMEELLERCHLLRKDHYVCYQDFLYKFMSRSSQGVAHRIITDPAHCFSVRTKTPAGYLSADDAEAKLVEFLHGDFLKLLGTFKSLDPHSLHLITQLQFRDAISKVFNLRVTDHQLAELLQEVGTTEDGLVPYPEFLAIFNKKRNLSTNLNNNNAHPRAPSVLVSGTPVPVSSWPPSSTPPLVHSEPGVTQRVEPTPTPQRVPNEAMTPDDKPVTRKKCVMEGRYRPVYKISQIVQDKLDSNRPIAKEAFERLDAKGTGRIDRTQLHYWLQALGVILHPTELQSLWRALQTSSDGLVNQGELLDFFTDPERRKPFIDDQASLRKAKSTFNDLPGYPGGLQRSKVTRKQDTTHTPRNSLGSPNLDILGKIRPQVVDHWEDLKEILKESDPDGCGVISLQEFKNICHFLKVKLSDAQLTKLLDQFDFDKNNQFHYLQFMQMFALPSSSLTGRNNRSSSDMKYDRETHRVAYEGSQGAVEESVSGVMHKIKCQLTRDWKTLRRAFKQADLDKDGYLSVAEFKACVRKIIRDIKDNDLFYVVSELDDNMDGKISYGEFFKQLNT